MIIPKYSKKKIIKNFTSFFTNGQPRSIGVKKNIISSFFIKGLSITISLVMVPMTIHYVNPSQYGIWLTLSSIVGWVSFFDIGFTNGFRNKFAIALSNGDDILARHYVSTIYITLSLIFLTVWFSFCIVNYWIDWSSILNINKVIASQVSFVAIIVFTYFCLQFVLKILNTIITADQKPAKAALLDTISQLFSLLIIFLLTKFTNGSLINLSLALSVSPIVVLTIASFWLFSHDYKKYKPSLKLSQFKYVKDILNLGLIFFVIQIAGIIQFQTTNFLIAHFFGTYDVTSYNIAFKYFSVLNMGFSILLLPYWSAVTEAYSKSDIIWIINSKNKYLKMWGICFILGIIMLIFAPFIYDLWIGKGVVNVPTSVSLWVFIFVITSTFGGIYVAITNGIGAIRIQFYMCLISPLIFLSISFFLIKHFSLGISSILIASVLSNINGFIVAPIQCNKILKGKQGIWIK